MIEYRFIKDNVLIKAFLPKGGRRNIIYAPGLPQYIDKRHELVQQFTALGCNLFVPVYTGTYESDGNFTLKNSVSSLEKAADLVKSGHAESLYDFADIKWSPSVPYIVGFSYGALPALLQKTSADGILLICPFVAMSLHETSQYGENIHTTLDFLMRAYQNTYRFNKNDLISELKNISLPQEIKNLFIVYSSEDPSIPLEEIQWLRNKYQCEAYDKKGSHSASVGKEIFEQIFYSSPAKV